MSLVLSNVNWYDNRNCTLLQLHNFQPNLAYDCRYVYVSSGTEKEGPLTDSLDGRVKKNMNHGNLQTVFFLKHISSFSTFWEIFTCTHLFLQAVGNCNSKFPDRYIISAPLFFLLIHSLIDWLVDWFIKRKFFDCKWYLINGIW